MLFGLASSELTRAGERIGLKTVHEVFADRTYQSDGSLTARSNEHALITDEKLAVAQIIQMVKQGKVTSVQQTDVRLKADTVCVHGDGVHAVQFAKTIRERLQQEGIILSAFNGQ